MSPLRRVFARYLKASIPLLLAVAALSLIGCGNSEPPYNITGTWYVYQITNTPASAPLPYDIGGINYPWTFTQESNDTVIGTTGDGMSFTGGVNDTAVNFMFEDTNNGVIYYFIGRLGYPPQIMSGTWYSVYNGVNQNTGTWAAGVFMGVATPITGNWSVTPPVASLPASFTLQNQSNANQLTGTTSDNQPITGTQCAGNVVMYWPSDGLGNYVLGTASFVGESPNNMSGAFFTTTGAIGNWSMSD